MFKATTPPKVFALLSLLMIVVMVVGTAYVQSSFYRQSIIDREALIVRDLVNALATEHRLLATDLDDYTAGAARLRLDQSFEVLKHLAGTTRIKVFNRAGTIVWSDDERLVGTRHTRHLGHLARAMTGAVQPVLNPAADVDTAREPWSSAAATIECYVPITSNRAGVSGVLGVLSLYRDQQDVNRSIGQGLYLLWGAIGVAGLLLFVALFQLFWLVYRRQKTAESNLSKLTLEHDRILQIEKMSAMGELVGEIAHQLNNPLVGVVNLTQLAERQVHDPQRVAALLVQVRKAGMECRDIVQRILRINQPSRSDLQATDMAALVQDTLVFCRQSIAGHPVLEFAAPAAAITLQVDPVLLRQALFNLIHNAILAAPDKPVKVTLAYISRQGLAGAQLDVTDAGPGFDGATQAKLFKPFFTTRATGTGLGLPVAQHIAMKHGGVVLAENLATGGARFSIWLPLATTF